MAVISTRSVCAGREADGVAERIHRIHQALRLLRGQPRAHGVDIGISAAFVFRWQGMRAQRCGAHREGQLAAQAPRHSQAACFVRFAQSVAGFDLQARHTFGHQSTRTDGGGGEQFVIGCSTCGRHRGADATAGPRNLLVAGA